jgi:DNA-binding transcriptional ArsR family regulator
LLIHDASIKKTVLRAMADESSLAILTCTKEKARSPMELIHLSKLPPSSVYRRISEFVDCGLLTVERIVVTKDGKKYSLYKSAVKEIRVDYKTGDLELDITFNLDVVDKMTTIWTTLRSEK